MKANRKLIVEVIDARNLAPKDGHGASSPYVIIDYHGQRRKTRSVIRDLNPAWNETLEFNVGKTSQVLGDTLEVDVLHDKNIGPTTRNNFLGRLRLSSTQFVKKGEEALIYYPLDKKNVLSWIQGEIGLKIYFVDEEPKSEDPAETPPPIKEENAETTPVDHPGDGDKPPEEPPAPPVEENPQVMASVSSGSLPQIKVDNINAPQPISRVSSVTSFISDQSTIERSTFDLVEKMHYLFVRVVRARRLPATGSPVVKIALSGRHVVSKPALRSAFFDWDQTFAFNRESPDSANQLQVSVWDPLSSASTQSDSEPIPDVSGHDFLGGICFDVDEIPLRDPPDSTLAPQWYRLEGGPAPGDLMLATWIGTQADESFPDAWKAETSPNPTAKSKVYQSPKLWYLRSTVTEAQDISMVTPLRESSFHVKIQLGFQVLKTKPVLAKTGNPSWNEDLLFVAAEPFTEQNLVFYLIENRQPKEQVIVGICKAPLTSIERRVDDRNVVSRWFNLEDPNEEKRVYRGRIHLKLCFDGGYHVMDEGSHVCSDYRPTARQLWKPPIGTIELGIIGCKNLVPMKTMEGKGSTDAYAVAKYGNKWVRTRTISDSLDPRWNEQYTWRVYDPSTVLTVGVFDTESESEPEPVRPNFRMGKVRIRISTLATGTVYRSEFSLYLLSQAGLKKIGEIELAVRFTRSTPTVDLLHVYAQPLLPTMHHTKPLGVVQQEALRAATVKIVCAHMSLSEPPLRREVVTYMLDADSNTFSLRKVRANWYRIINVIKCVMEMFKWIDDTRSWKNPTATMLLHALLVMLVWFPDLIVPTLAFYVFAVGVWNYRLRCKTSLPHFDPKISLAECVDGDEIDEEFDAMPCTRPNEMVRARYDKLRMLGARVQTVLGDLATQGERLQALVTWRDPRATGIFVVLCFLVAFMLYLVPSKMVAMAFGFYYMRHPVFRDRMPSPALNFFRRLPSLSDIML